jgi:AraC-like DNA-binding protein
LSYDPRILFDSISRCLKQNPSISLGTLSQQLQLSRRTIQKTVVVACGKNFRDLREEVLIARVKNLFISEPTLAIKAISFSVGYESPRSFARAIKRACGFSPEKLRSVAAEEFLNGNEAAATGEHITNTSIEVYASCGKDPKIHKLV